jgi:hypothetical protein
LELGCTGSKGRGRRDGRQVLEHPQGLFYTAVFSVTAYAVVINDRYLIKIILPVAGLIVDWWIWKDMKVMLDQRQREREGRSANINQRLDHLEDRLENRVDGL